MDTEEELLEALGALSYKGKCSQSSVLSKAIDGGLRSAECRDLVFWLTNELHILRKTDECLSVGIDDVNEFSMELSAMLKELGCPYRAFVTGPLSERFQSRVSIFQLLDFLASEVMASKMTATMKQADQSLIIPKEESKCARALEQLTLDLDVGKPPENVAPRALFDKIGFKLTEKLRKINKGVVSDPLLKAKPQLTVEQWTKLAEAQAALEEEYNLRREMLLTRLEVTVQSFKWSDKMKSRGAEIDSKFAQKLQELEPFRHGGDNTSIVAMLAARTDLAIIEKTSSANVRKNTGCKIQKHVMGSVPDRGGRANEMAPPPPEMPSWQQQRSGGPSGGGANRGGGRGGGAQSNRGGRASVGGNSANQSGGGGGGGGNFGKQSGVGGGGGNFNNQGAGSRGGGGGGRFSGGNFGNQTGGQGFGNQGNFGGGGGGGGGGFTRGNFGTQGTGGGYGGDGFGGRNDGYGGRNDNYGGRNDAYGGCNNGMGNANSSWQPNQQIQTQSPFEQGLGQNWMSGSGRVQGTNWNPQNNRNFGNDNGNGDFGYNNYAKRGRGGHQRGNNWR